MAPTPGIARPLIKAVGEKRLGLIETGGTEDRVDQHLREKVALRMAASDPPDGVPNRKQLFDNRHVILAAMSDHRPG